MAKVQLSVLARADLKDIARYGEDVFGLDQALRYEHALGVAFARLARNPFVGQSAERIGPGLRRHPHASHVIFYRPVPGGILVVRVMARITGVVFDG